jgi:hypothetical protein
MGEPSASALSNYARDGAVTRALPPLPLALLQDAQAVDRAVQVAMLALLHLELLVLVHAVGGPLGLLAPQLVGGHCLRLLRRERGLRLTACRCPGHRLQVRRMSRMQKQQYYLFEHALRQQREQQRLLSQQQQVSRQVPLVSQQAQQGAVPWHAPY